MIARTRPGWAAARAVSADSRSPPVEFAVALRLVLPTAAWWLTVVKDFYEAYAVYTFFAFPIALFSTAAKPS